MKNSNKILLGGFFTIVLVLVGVYVALHARYKAGDYTTFNGNVSDEDSNTKEFANARHIDIRYFKNVSVYVGDRMKVETSKYDDNEIILVEKDGMVQLSLKDSLSTEDAAMFGPVSVYVPENSLVTSYMANIRILGQVGKMTKSLNFNAYGGRLTFTQYKNILDIDSLNVTAANNALIELQNARIAKLNVQLNASELSDEKAVINQLKLDADSVSRVNLQFKHLLKFTTKTTAHE